MNRAQQAAEIAGRRPLTQFWDPTEPKLLVCEAAHIPGMLHWETSNSKSPTRKLMNEKLKLILTFNTLLQKLQN